MRRDLPSSVRRHLLALIRKRLRRDGRVVVAIDGAAGLGKTTLARELQAAFPEDSTVLHTDDYLTERRERFAQRITAYDPRAIDTDTLARDASALVERQSVTVRPYQHPTGTHGVSVVVPARPLLIVEGAHSLDQELHLTPPIGVFIHGNERARYELRRERDINKRGAVARTFDSCWPKMNQDYERYVRPKREQADLFINCSLTFTTVSTAGHTPRLRRDTTAPNPLLNLHLAVLTRA